MLSRRAHSGSFETHLPPDATNVWTTAQAALYEPSERAEAKVVAAFSRICFAPPHGISKIRNRIDRALPRTMKSNWRQCKTLVSGPEVNPKANTKNKMHQRHVVRHPYHWKQRPWPTNTPTGAVSVQDSLGVFPKTDDDHGCFRGCARGAGGLCVAGCVENVKFLNALVDASLREAGRRRQRGALRENVCTSFG